MTCPSVISRRAVPRSILYLAITVRQDSLAETAFHTWDRIGRSTGFLTLSMTQITFQCQFTFREAISSKRSIMTPTLRLMRPIHTVTRLWQESRVVMSVGFLMDQSTCSRLPTELANFS